MNSRFKDTLFYAQIVANIVVLSMVVTLVVIGAGKLSEINQRQIDQIKAQNVRQLCVQHDIVIAIRQVAIKLGLPVSDILVPSVRGLDCAT